jgi:hypothetical protein
MDPMRQDARLSTGLDEGDARLFRAAYFIVAILSRPAQNAQILGFHIFHFSRRHIGSGHE